LNDKDKVRLGKILIAAFMQLPTNEVTFIIILDAIEGSWHAVFGVAVHSHARFCQFCNSGCNMRDEKSSN